MEASRDRGTFDEVKNSLDFKKRTLLIFKVLTQNCFNSGFGGADSKDRSEHGERGEVAARKPSELNFVKYCVCCEIIIKL